MASQPAYAPDETPVGGAMSDEELATFLAEHETRSIGYYESEIASDQADAIDRYYRRPYGDERDGCSQVVDATVAITVDNALAAILKPFVSSDETVVFEPRGPEDVEQAEQATDYVNYVLHNDNCGFQIFHDWFKDALLSKLGVVKVYWEDYSREKIERLGQLDAMQLEQMAQDIVDVYGPDENGLYTADVRRIEQDGKCCIEVVPPEEYRISPLARPGKTPPYEAHITAKTRSELVEMGFDPEVVDAIPAASQSLIEDSRTQARYGDEDYLSAQLGTPGDKSRETVLFKDEFALVDYDGDGVSELRRIMRANDKIILYNEEVDGGCFARLCPVPMPHKIYGQSLADQVIDEQRIATVLWRQTLDNLYRTNNPRPVVPEGSERDDGSTVDDLNATAPGQPLRVKSAEGFGQFAVPFFAEKSFPMLAYVGQQAEARTGISKQGQGMDPDSIDKAGQITATQSAIMEDGRNERSELIARIFAETGVKDLFKKMLRLLVEHQPRARMIRLRNKWVEMDPRSWNADMDLSISVGLGIGNKAQQIAVADGILQTIAMAKQDPAASTLFPLEKIYNAIKRKFTASGIKDTDEFIAEPQRDEEGNVVEPEMPPDPAIAEAQAKLQIEQMKAEHKIQLDQAGLEQKTQEAIHKIELAQIEAATKAHLEEQRAAFEADLAERKFQFEARMAVLEHQLEEARAARDADRADKQAEAKVQNDRSGGDLSK